MPVQKSKVELAMEFGSFIDAFQIMIPAKTLTTPILIQGLSPTDDREIQSINYRTYLLDGISTSDQFKSVSITLEGLPRGRRVYWIYGIICVVLMLLSGGVLSWKSYRSSISTTV